MLKAGYQYPLAGLTDDNGAFMAVLVTSTRFSKAKWAISRTGEVASNQEGITPVQAPPPNRCGYIAWLTAMICWRRERWRLWSMDSSEQLPFSSSISQTGPACKSPWQKLSIHTSCCHSYHQITIATHTIIIATTTMALTWKIMLTTELSSSGLSAGKERP